MIRFSTTEIALEKPSAMQVQVISVKTKQDQKEFLNLPWTLYRKDPNWVPPLRQHQREVCGFANHPFYNDAQSQAFIAKKDGKTVGRILAVVDRNHNQYYDSKFGMFGFFESINDSAVARALFDQVKKYHREKGLDTLRGPVNPSMNYECGLLINGFDSPPVFMMTYNPPFYEKLYEENGLEKAHDLHAYLGHVSQLKDNEHRWSFINEKLKEKIGLQLRPMRRPDFDKELRAFLEVYNSSLPGSWGFVPITDPEMDHMAKGLRHLIVPELTVVAEVNGKTAGCSFGMLDYNQRIKAIDGKLFPFGFIRLIWNRKKIKRIRVISNNVLPEYQKSKGIGLSLFSGLIPTIYNRGIEECEYSWVLESNRLSRATLERCQTKLYKTYRIYDCPLD